MSDIPLPGAARDESNLQALRDAHRSGDIVAERAALARLLTPYLEWGRSIAYAKLNGVPNRAADADEIAQELMRRLLKALKRDDFEGPFHALAATNLGWAIKDYWRARFRDKASSMDPSELPDRTDTDRAMASATEQVDAFAPYLEGLSEHDREVVIERIFLDMTPVQIAAKHGMSRGAVDTALHRSLKKLRQSPQLDDVRNRYESTA